MFSISWPEDVPLVLGHVIYLQVLKAYLKRRETQLWRLFVKHQLNKWIIMDAKSKAVILAKGLAVVKSY